MSVIGNIFLKHYVFVLRPPLPQYVFTVPS